VLSVHDCLNRGYFQLARKILGHDNVTCATYCGEFSGGWGYSRNWIEPSVDMFFSRTQTAQDYAIKKGIGPEKARVRGYLMHPNAHYEVIAPRSAGSSARSGSACARTSSRSSSRRAATAPTTTSTCSRRW